ncbi:hypothetical protein Ddye_026826 [Dipteronia dyeriana]|uniref:Uncharacterized protein n=1 Tax=Dipteronia dyeriana TaxID=168575 RepID=A0AAD9WPW7_9ROSI|nr:hypothetical protein Ddye_026826 [Dipteronia dyeriana]
MLYGFSCRCPLLNISYCPPSETVFSDDKSLPHLASKISSLMVRGKVVFTKVPQNVVVSAASSDSSALIGATSTTRSSRHVFSLGFLENSNASPGSNSAREDFTLHDEVSSDAAAENTFYILLLPVLEGVKDMQFRTSLQGTPENELQFCIESGDASVQTLQAHEAVFMNSRDNPFELFKDSINLIAITCVSSGQEFGQNHLFAPIG